MPTRCPVCGKVGLQPTAVECPQCNADLEVFQLLEVLQEVSPIQAPETEQARADEARVGEGAAVLPNRAPPASLSPTLLAVGLVSLFFGIGIGVGYLVVPRHDAVVPQAAIEPPLQQVQEPRVCEMVTSVMRTHRLFRSDTLWDIAERYYGTGDLYPALLVLNPGLGIHFSPGGEIRLPANRAVARQLLAGSIVEQAGQRLLRYPVVVGDTWQRISRRLYGRAKVLPELPSLNGDGPPKPGTSVLIPLP